jgi:endonuclease YncB( thermonuclease family)
VNYKAIIVNAQVLAVFSRLRHVSPLRVVAFIAVLFAFLFDQTVVANEVKREIEFKINHPFHVKGRLNLTTYDAERETNLTINLRDIDAPRLWQPCKGGKIPLYECGQISTGGLRLTVRNRTVNCTYSDPKDITHIDNMTTTIVADCFIANGEINISHELIGDGYAIYRGDDLSLIQLQVKAKQDKRGIWNYTFTDPEIWSQHNR